METFIQAHDNRSVPVHYTRGGLIREEFGWDAMKNDPARQDMAMAVLPAGRISMAGQKLVGGAINKVGGPAYRLFSSRGRNVVDAGRSMMLRLAQRSVNKADKSVKVLTKARDAAKSADYLSSGVRETITSQIQKKLDLAGERLFKAQTRAGKYVPVETAPAKTAEVAAETGSSSVKDFIAQAKGKAIRSTVRDRVKNFATDYPKISNTFGWGAITSVPVAGATAYAYWNSDARARRQEKEDNDKKAEELNKQVKEAWSFTTNNLENVFSDREALRDYIRKARYARDFQATIPDQRERAQKVYETTIDGLRASPDWDLLLEDALSRRADRVKEKLSKMSLGAQMRESAEAWYDQLPDDDKILMDKED